MPKDYTMNFNTPLNFLYILQGQNTSNFGKTIQSGPNDHIFLYFADHGAPGILGFDDHELNADDLNRVWTRAGCNFIESAMDIYS